MTTAIKIIIKRMDDEYLISILIVSIVVAVVIASIMYYRNFQGVQFSCGNNKCATDIRTGFKRCPDSPNSYVIYDPSTEVCNSINSCDNPITPFSVLSNGETTITGICDTEECRCSTTRLCPPWINVAFKDEENIVEQYILDGDRAVPAGYQCYLPATSAEKIGCPIRGTIFNIIEEVDNCLSLYPECGNLPLCESGYLALEENDLASRFACISETPCRCDQATYFDSKDGSITCKDLD